MKKYLLSICYFVVVSLLAGCTVFGKQPPVSLGEPEATLIARAGPPSARYPLANGQVLEYRRGPWGQETYMARVDADGRLLSWEQVLTTQKFATIEIDHDSKADVLRTIGAPSETTYLTLVRREVWSYPYKESGVWNSLMHVYFDDSGIVRKLENGPDPKFDPDPERGLFGRLR